VILQSRELGHHSRLRQPPFAADFDFAGACRPFHKLRGELLILPAPSPCPIPPSSAAAPSHLPRLPQMLVAGKPPATNQGRRRHQTNQRVALLLFRHARAPATRPIAGLNPGRAQL
jgi:hypothetical protein